MKSSLSQSPETPAAGALLAVNNEKASAPVLPDPLICSEDDHGLHLREVKDYAGYAIYARNRYCFARAEIDTWWWRWGAYLPLFRWCHTHLKWCIRLLILVFFLFILFPTYLPKWPKSYFASRATIISPQKLTDKAEIELFAYSLASARNQIVRLFQDPDLGAAPITMRALPRTFVRLNLPTTLSASMTDLPSVKGVDIGGIVKLFTAMGRYFTWRLESALAYNPPVKAEDGHPAAPPRMRAFANVRWAWHVAASAEVEREVWDQYDVDGVAVALVAQFMKEEF